MGKQKYLGKVQMVFKTDSYLRIKVKILNIKMDKR